MQSVYGRHSSPGCRRVKTYFFLELFRRLSFPFIKMGRTRGFNCTKCNTKHTGPVGDYCEKSNFSTENSTSVEMDEMRRQMSFMENMVKNCVKSVTDLTEAIGKAPTTTDDSRFDSGRSIPAETMFPVEEKKKDIFGQSNFVQEGESIDSVEMLIMCSFRTIDFCIEKGFDYSNVDSHIRFLLKKSLTKTYIFKAFTSYDRAIRDLANRQGAEAFALVDRELRDDYFSLENTIQVSKARREGPAKSNQKLLSHPCFNYNSETGCARDPCRYVHKCRNCDVLGHPIYKCTKSTGGKSGPK